jgi:glycosyltransferase involved in cell wall biosynthesis
LHVNHRETDMTIAPVLTAPPAAPSDVPRLRVAIVDEELPFPPTSGKRIRTLNLILRLATRHSLTYLCHQNADADEARTAAKFLGDRGIETVIVDRAVPSRSGLGFYARLAANLLSPLPYSVVSHNSRELRAAVAAHAATCPVDLWQCEWTPYTAALRELQGVRRLINAQNVESLIWRRYGETETNPLKRWYIHRQWRKFERFERRAVAEANQVVAVSDADAELFRKEFGAGHVAVVENGVDTVFFRPANIDRDARRILFLGSLDWRPNLDAVGQLLDHILPAVRTMEPLARLEIVGRNPPAFLRRRIEGTAGAELHANVTDVRPFLARCGVMAVPLRIGGGSRLKILEALACGTPVVSTLIGAEGLHLQAGRHFDVVPSIEHMADALVTVIREPERARMNADEGRRIVLERYDWDALADQLERIWLDCAAVPRVRHVPGCKSRFTRGESTRGSIP